MINPNKVLNKSEISKVLNKHTGKSEEEYLSILSSEGNFKYLERNLKNNPLDYFNKINIEGLNFYRHDFGCGYSRKLCTNYSNILENLKPKKINNYIIINPK